MDLVAADLPVGWRQQLAAEFERPQMQSLRAFLRRESEQYLVYPPREQVFHALASTAFADVKLVIIGQDPYHGDGQAHGLSFSVPKGQKPPPSLRNIFKEQLADVGVTPAAHGCLQSWAEQGVLLLNAVLTVRAHQAASHQKQGWEGFTDAIIERLNHGRDGLVFLLWGSHAQRKGRLIDRERHLVLEAPHPSPWSAYRGFFGCGHFSAANRYLEAQGKTPIDWQLR